MLRAPARRTDNAKFPPRSKLTLFLVFFVALSFAGVVVAQFQAHDPGVRPGADAGGPRSGLTSDYQTFFGYALARFGEFDSVSGTQPDHPV